MVIVAWSFFGPVPQPSQIPVGSVSLGAGYKATTTSALMGWAVRTPKTLSTHPGTLGSVVITGAAATLFELYDATTTNANLRAIKATTTLASFPTSAAAGTYTFDVDYNVGLIAEFKTGTAIATTTITWR